MRARPVLALLFLGLVSNLALGQTAGMLGFQGLIKDAAGNPITGTVDLEFRIFDAETFGNLVDMNGDDVFDDVTIVLGVTVTDGILSAKFGPVHPKAFDGTERWLEVSVDGSPMSRVEMVTAPAVAERFNLPGTATPAIAFNAVTGNIDVNGSIFVNGQNLHLAGPDFTMAAPGRGDGGRALVHFGDGVNEQLVINFANDFNDGVQVQSDLEVTGTLDITGTPGVDGVKYPDGTLQTTASTGTDTLSALACASGEVAKWNGAAWACAADDSGGGGASTLDEAYDGGGLGAGRIITADQGAVQIDGAGGLVVAGTIQSGSSIIIDGTAGTITGTGPLFIEGTEPDLSASTCCSSHASPGCDDATCEAESLCR